MEGIITMNEIIFKDAMHKKFYIDMLLSLDNVDVHHKCLVYLLGLTDTTRMNFAKIYDVQTGLIQHECVCESWNTRSTLKIIRLAFILYTDKLPMPMDVGDTSHDESENIHRRYALGNIFFDAEHFDYFVQALKIRFNYA